MQDPAEGWRAIRAARKSCQTVLFLFAFLEMWKDFWGSVKKKGLKCFSWSWRACQRIFGSTSILCGIQALIRHASLLHLTCRRRRSWILKFNRLFFCIFETQPALCGSAGNTEVKAEPLLWLRFSRAELWPPEDLLCSLAHAKALDHLFPLCSPLLCHPPSVLSDLSMLGLVNPPGKRDLKGWTEPGSPESHKFLQPFFLVQ